MAVQVTWEHHNDAYVLFAENGVHIYQRWHPALKAHVPGLWAFSDSNPITLIPTTAFTSAFGARIFQTAPPTLRHQNYWMEKSQIMPYIMDLWSVEEIEDLAYVTFVASVAAQLSDQAALLALFPNSVTTTQSISKPSWIDGGLFPTH